MKRDMVTDLITYWRTPQRVRELGDSYAPNNARLLDWRADPKQPSLWMPYFTPRLHSVARQGTFGTTAWAYSEGDDALIAKGEVVAGVRPPTAAEAAEANISDRGGVFVVRWHTRVMMPWSELAARVGWGDRRFWMGHARNGGLVPVDGDRMT
jgi:hypothetical protein